MVALHELIHFCKEHTMLSVHSVVVGFFFFNIFCPALLSGFLSFGIHSHGTDLGFHLKLTGGQVSFGDWWGGGRKGLF